MNSSSRRSCAEAGVGSPKSAPSAPQKGSRTSWAYLECPPRAPSAVPGAGAEPQGHPGMSLTSAKMSPGLTPESPVFAPQGAKSLPQAFRRLVLGSALRARGPCVGSRCAGTRLRCTTGPLREQDLGPRGGRGARQNWRSLERRSPAVLPRAKLQRPAVSIAAANLAAPRTISFD